MKQQVLSIGQVNAYIQSQMNQDPLLGSIAVRGEISNYKCYPSGHHYFSLKDETGTLKCVMYRGNAMHLRFQPKNGMKVIAMGRISVFLRDGVYQLYCSAMIADGVGDLYAAFEQLKAKLQKQGLFDESHKKPIPEFPGVIGVVTSEAGAAVHDILRILRKRYPLAKVRLFPVLVQGAGAAEQIAAAIRYANHWKLADLLIVGRGGGSMEELWAFNEEPVAYAIFESEIPVISAVGHEPDFTIADYVADLRAATPTNGAELAVPDQEALMQELDSRFSAMEHAVLQKLQGLEKEYRFLSSRPCLQNPGFMLAQREQRLNLLKTHLLSAQQKAVSCKNEQFIRLTAKLDAMSPLKVLTRGYAMARTEDKSILKSVHQVKPGDRITVTVEDGTLSAKVDGQEEKAI